MKYCASLLAGFAAICMIGSAGAADFSVATIDSAARALPRLHSLLVSRRGELIFERYYNATQPSRPANIKSAAKSVISALVGIAIERRVIADVRTPIVTFFPEREKRQARIPAAIAPSMSRSSRSPMCTTSAGSTDNAPATATNERGSGFSAPVRSLATSADHGR